MDRSLLCSAAVHASKKPQYQAKSFNTLHCILIFALREYSDMLRMRPPEREDTKVVAAGHAHASDDQRLG